MNGERLLYKPLGVRQWVLKEEWAKSCKDHDAFNKDLWASKGHFHEERRILLAPAARVEEARDK